MLKHDTIKISISYRNKTHYLKLGYNPILNKDLEIKTEHLPSSSHVRVDVICALCSTENNIMYDKYINNVSRQGFYGCRKCSRQKAAMTSLDKYGVDNYSKTNECRERVEKTNMEKYGFKTNLLTPKHKEITRNILFDKYGTENFWEIRRPNGKNKLIINENIIKTMIINSEDLYTTIYMDNNFHLYRNECRRITNTNSKLLIENWDGLDFYTNDDISDNFNLDFNDSNYPTIDHKTSIYFGYNNGISSTEIGSIENLCITKRSLNSKKRDLCEKEFLEKLKSQS
jgi:hypothetical protein